MKQDVTQFNRMFRFARLALPAIAILGFATAVLAMHPSDDSGESSDKVNDIVPQTKFVGTRDTPGFCMEMLIFDNAGDVAEFCPAIVIASFSEQPRDVPIYSTAREDAKQKEFYEEIKDSIGDRYVTKYQLNIDKVLTGELEDSVITLFQSGKYGSDYYETKLKPDTKYILFLYKKSYEEMRKTTPNGVELKSLFEDDKILYQVPNGEGGIFEILPDDTLYSYVDYGFGPTFDGKHYSELIKEIQR